MSVISSLLINMWWIVPLCVTIYFYYLIYNVLVEFGRSKIITTLLITIPLRLITGICKGFIYSIVLIFYGFITLLFIFLPFYFYTRSEIFKDLIVYGTIFLFFAPYIYFIVKILKEELDYLKVLASLK